jgi:2,5-diamino-6-(ribosylamino)-4(3H)-pyrimidinone 5'-phosphate reductase
MADTSRPRVVLSVGMSVDARVTLRRDTLLLDEHARQLMAVGVPPSAEHLEAARQALISSLYKPRVVLEGSGTFVTDDAGPLTDLPSGDEPDDVLYGDYLPADVMERSDHDGWFTVVDSRGRVRWTMSRAPGLEWDLLVLVARATPRDYLAFLRRERICYLVVGGGRVDLLAALHRMRDLLGVDCVVSKAGGSLNGALLRAGVIDELHLLISPTAIGGLGTPTLFDGPELAPGQAPTPLRLLAAHIDTDGMVSLRYEVVRDT